MKRAFARVGFAVLACSCTRHTDEPRAVAPTTPSPTPKVSTDVDGELEARNRGVIVAEHRHLRECYERGLARDPELAGRVVLVLEVGENGRAMRVFEGRREGLGDAEVRCFAKVLEAAHFHDGAARAMRIQVPLAFTRADAR